MAKRSKRRPTIPGQVVLVLQGGGALGAYQVGVYEALHEAGIEPDWVIGTSIGAINAALIAANRPEDRIARLTEFWQHVEQDAGHDLARFFIGLANVPANLATITRGIPAFFAPFPFAWAGPHVPLGVERAAYYTTAPLRETLAPLVDFDVCNGHRIRLTVGAVNVRNGEMRYFDSRDTPIALDHVIASGALPPAFPAVRIDGDPYWDGGIYSNTPIEAVLDDMPRKDSVIFAVNMWNPEGPEPETIWQVLGRQKDIQYASRAQSHIARQKQIHHLRHVIREIAKHVPSARRTPELAELGVMGLWDDDACRAAHRAQARRRGPHEGHRFHAGGNSRALAGGLRRHAADARPRTVERAGRPDRGRHHSRHRRRRRARRCARARRPRRKALTR